MNFLVDTSVWKTLFTQGATSPASQRLVDALHEEEGLATTGVIAQELLMGFRNDPKLDDLRACFNRYCGLATTTPSLHDHIAASALQQRAWQLDLSLGLVDALLIHLAIDRRLTLLSEDPLHAKVAMAFTELELWQPEIDHV